MRILLTNNHLKGLGGSETATYTIARALKDAGHEVAIFTRVLGDVSDRLQLEGFDVVSDIARFRGRVFDCAHIHHNTCARLVRDAFPKLPMVYLGHGVVPALEAPPPKDVRVAVHAAVSEEIAAAWKEKHGIERTEIVRNAIDLVRFRPVKPIHERCERILVIRGPKDTGAWRVAAMKMSAEITFVGAKGTSIWKIERKINEADLVVGVGRCALEAMACGRAVFVMNQQLGDGMLTEPRYFQSRIHNFSGRCFARKFTDPDKITSDIILGYRHWPMAPMNRTLVEHYHDANDCAKRLTGLYETAVRHG